MKANKLNKEIPLPNHTATTEELSQMLGEDLIKKRNKNYIKKSICSVKLYRFLNRHGKGEWSTDSTKYFAKQTK
tara:strand:+ start:187 stop:408 length:222 start_codon:yes stop_codon:yes gene_type:complete